MYQIIAHYNVVIMLVARSKWGKGEWPLLLGHTQILVKTQYVWYVLLLN